MEARRRHHRAKPTKQIERLEDEHVGAVAPRLLHRVGHAAVGAQLEAVLGDGREVTRMPCGKSAVVDRVGNLAWIRARGEVVVVARGE